ncbi:DUF6307 family protein [Amycolatopsis sp. NPDC059657]|uniref:DUF6307 family protein n=1 Tax=Amycolatopsis sp. NPDC059657 TaxID=3346899 RepID=UPI0036710E5A
MTATAPYVSRYDKRVALVQELVSTNTKLNDKASRELAVKMVHALDTVPESVR